MHTLVKAAFVPFRRTLLTALPLLGLLALAGNAEAQQPQPPFGPQPQPGQGPGFAPSPFGPQPGQQPGGFNPQQGPGQPPGQPGFGPPPNGGFGGPPGGPPAPQGGDPGFNGSFSGEVNTGGLAPAPAAPTPEMDDEERAMTLMEQPSLSGSTGLLHTSYAGSGAQGTFRTSFLIDYFSTSNFLCNKENTTLAGTPRTCNRQNTNDSASHVGAFFALNATPLSWLEGYATIRTYANSNDQGRPQLLQVLGDTTFGAKAFTPARLGKLFTFGGEAQLLLLNGTGDVGVAGGGTSALFRGLATADFRKPAGQGLPLRINLNVAYKLDNSGKLVEDVEIKRAAALGLVNDSGTDPGPARSPISRVERFGLGINRVDFFQMYLGVELPFKKVQPYLEWTMDIPVNRQGYICHTSRVSKGDECLGLDKFDAATPKTQGGPGFKAVPSRLSIGARTNPFNGSFRGLSAHLAFDIGTSGTSTFVEEVAPQAPWTMYVGLGYAFDTREKVIPPPPPPPVAPPPVIIPIPQSYARGVVHEQGKQDAVADAIITIEGGGQPPFATGADGRFLTRHLEPGQYKFNIKAPGYKPGTCTAIINPPPAPNTTGGAMQPGMQGGPGTAPGQFGQPQVQFGTPGQNPFGPQGQGQFGQPGGMGGPGMAPPVQAPPAAPQGPTYVDVDCPLEAEPKLGNLVGQVKDGEGGAPVAGAVVRLTDAGGKSLSATADGTGNFTFKDLGPGAVTLNTEAAGYMRHIDTAQVRVSDDNRTNITINKRPKIQLVKVLGNEIRVSKQIHFETDSAKILGDSNSLMEEISDVLQRTPTIKKVEIQGHTDNTGTRERNMQLSEARAAAVKTWLTSNGIDGSRLVAKGYGQDRPLAPNVTAGNRTKNRRVQFIILEGK